MERLSFADFAAATRSEIVTVLGFIATCGLAASALATILRIARPSRPTHSAAQRAKSCDRIRFATGGYVRASPFRQSSRIRAQASRSGSGICSTRSQREVKALSTA